MNFGQKILKLRSRLRASPSPEWLGDQIGVHGLTIRRIESKNQRPRVDLALKLARFFDVPLDWLADDAADWPPPETRDDRLLAAVKTALAAGGLGGGLTGDESSLLSGFRSLRDPVSRGRALAYVDGLRGADPPEAPAGLDRAVQDERN